MRNAAETFGLERELMGRWENSTTRGGAGGPVRLVKGQIVIVDDTVDHDAPGRREPLNYWIYRRIYGRFERGVQLLTVAIVGLSTGRTFTVSPTP